MRADLDMMDGLRYSWASLIFYFGYMLGTYPISLLAQRFPTRWVITAICLRWGVVVLSTPACKTFEHFLVNRFFLGLIEAGVSPMFMLVVGLWYTHAEQVSRSSWWYSFSGGSLLVSPLINYGLGHITGGSLQPWQYMYFIAGAAVRVLPENTTTQKKLTTCRPSFGASHFGGCSPTPPSWPRASPMRSAP